ncbi:hypothetical protein QJS66_18130 [Kocuria rhizophila]|nr:hypothetical protein QJS66_18130 [Kocuria rhizophila]
MVTPWRSIDRSSRPSWPCSPWPGSEPRPPSTSSGVLTSRDVLLRLRGVLRVRMLLGLSARAARRGLRGLNKVGVLPTARPCSSRPWCCC